MALLKLPHIGKLENNIFIRTDNPLKEIWEHILLLGDFHFLSKRWENQSTETITTVSTSIKQAHEYFIASKSATLLTRPLLIYYCFICLAKAVLYLTENKPHDLHGLGQPEVSESLLDVSVTLKSKGIFPCLAEYLGYKYKSGQQISIEQFVVNVIELIESYERYYNKSGLVITPKVEVFLDGDINIFFESSLFGNKSSEDFRALLERNTNLFDDFQEVENETGIELNIRNPIPKDRLNIDGAALMKKHFSHSVYPDSRYYLNLHDEDIRVPSTLAYLGIMFTLGSIVRYYPKEIDRFLSDKNTSNIWFIQQLCDCAERVFPNLMLNHYYNTNFIFAASSW
ncbi:MAG: YaaC family protein [Thermodesulfobacteriota bacterium]